MNPENMNEINEDGKAFNGNYKAVLLAAFLISMTFFALLTHLVLLIFERIGVLWL